MTTAPAKQPAHPIRLYGFPLSGHSHRVELFLTLLDLPYEFIYVDLPKKAQKEAAFLARNPRGQVPVIEDGDITLYDSTAILVYLAKQYGEAGWLPSDPADAARVQQFLSLASGEVLEGPGKARLVKVFGAPHDYALATQKAAALRSGLSRRRCSSADSASRQSTHLRTASPPTGSRQSLGWVAARVPRSSQSRSSRVLPSAPCWCAATWRSRRPAPPPMSIRTSFWLAVTPSLRPATFRCP